MFVGAVFLGAGVALAALRKRAATKNECHDFPEFGLGKGLIKSCCSSTASLTGLLEAAQAEEILKGVAVTTTGGETQQEEPMCKFCDVTACCRFCFAGPEQGELCAPCLCVGTQELVHFACLRQWQTVSMRTRGVRERKCRVCNARFKVPRNLNFKFHGKLRKLKLWFSLTAKDRLDLYANAWWHSLIHVIQRERQDSRRAGTRPTVRNALARKLGGFKQLFFVAAVAELCVWAGREVKRDDNGGLAQNARLVKTAAMFGSILVMKRGD